ncbi:MAG: nucleotidyltransferase family protein [Roseburia sp.]|nr:nucleotidyltransferase family protein [Roseburia sp.]
MNITGIIAEYNPFHNGHAYQIAKARELTDADYMVVVMSGNYVQRGAPALTDKFTRAKMALNNGADMVVELPALWASAAAPDFAAGGCALLDKLGCVTHISYGCEAKEPAMLCRLAKILADEPERFALSLKKYQKKGKSFPSAMEHALSDYLKTESRAVSPLPDREELHSLFSSPNNILALEYEKNSIKRRMELIPCPISRKGCGYHDSDLTTDFSSATGIRHGLFSGENFSPKDHMPETAAELLPPVQNLLRENDFSQMLYYKLLSEASGGFEKYMGSSPFLSNRIKNNLDLFFDYTDFCDRLKTKEVTYAKISRLLLHILLNFTEEDTALGKSLDYIPYLRLLGFRQSARPLLKIIETHGDAPILTKPAAAKAMLSEKAFQIYEKDLFSSNLYYGLQAQKKRGEVKNEYRKSLVIL